MQINRLHRGYIATQRLQGTNKYGVWGTFKQCYSYDIARDGEPLNNAIPMTLLGMG